MTNRERNLLAARYLEIGDDLESLAQNRGAEEGPSYSELTLRVEQEEIEHRLGADAFERRDPE